MYVLFFVFFFTAKKLGLRLRVLTTSYSATAASRPVAVCGRGGSRCHDPPHTHTHHLTWASQVVK